MSDEPLDRPHGVPDAVRFAIGETGAGARVALDTSFTKPPRYIWTHVRRDGADAGAFLAAIPSIDEFVRQALTREDTRPRCTAHRDGVILNLRGVNLAPGAEPEDMVSVRLWITDHDVVGVWLRPLKAIDDLIAAVERGQAPPTPGEWAARLALRLIDRMEPIVAALNEAIDDLEETGRDGGASALRLRLAEVRRRATLLRRFIAPQRDALSTLAIEDAAWLSDADRAKLRDAVDRTTRMVEELEAARERAAIVNDQIIAERSDVMNQRMYVLAIVTAVFLPLGLVTGLLGVNVGGMPGVDSAWAFWIVCALLAVLAIGLWRVFKRLGLL